MALHLPPIPSNSITKKKIDMDSSGDAGFILLIQRNALLISAITEHPFQPLDEQLSSDIPGIVLVHHEAQCQYIYIINFSGDIDHEVRI